MVRRVGVVTTTGLAMNHTETGIATETSIRRLRALRS